MTPLSLVLSVSDAFSRVILTTKSSQMSGYSWMTTDFIDQPFRKSRQRAHGAEEVMLIEMPDSQTLSKERIRCNGYVMNYSKTQQLYSMVSEGQESESSLTAQFGSSPSCQPTKVIRTLEGSWSFVTFTSRAKCLSSCWSCKATMTQSEKNSIEVNAGSLFGSHIRGCYLERPMPSDRPGTNFASSTKHLQDLGEVYSFF